MPDTPITESADAVSDHRKPSSRSRWTPSRWLTLAALALATIAVALAGLAYLHPAHTNAPAAPQQGGDAKANVCSAYADAHKAVVINTHLRSSNPDAQLAIAANARLALIGGGSYLRERLAANTAAPGDLVDAATSLANTIQQLGMNYLTDAPPDVQNAIRKDLNSQIAQLDKLCA